MAARTLCVCVISLFKDCVFASPKQSLTLFTCKYPYLCHDATLGNFYGVLKFLPWLMVMMTRMTLVRICDTFSRMAEAFLPIVPSSITPPTWSSLWWFDTMINMMTLMMMIDDETPCTTKTTWETSGSRSAALHTCEKITHPPKNCAFAKKLHICANKNIYYTTLTISIFTHNQLSVPPFVKTSQECETALTSYFW